MPKPTDISKILIFGSMWLFLLGTLRDSSKACELVFAKFVAEPSFQVEVRFQTTSQATGLLPAPGVKIGVSQLVDHKIVTIDSVVSDSNGSANFEGRNPGTYFISTEKAGVYGARGDLEVAAQDPKARNTLLLGWPLAEIVTVKKLSGQLALEGTALRGIHVTLINAENERPLSTISPDEHRNFQFGDLPDALYVLHITLSRTVTTVNPFDVQGYFLATQQRRRPPKHS